MATSWTRASLRILSEALSPSDIEKALGVSADKRLAKGEPVSPTKGGPIRTHTCCSYRSNMEKNEPIEKLIDRLLDFIKAHLDKMHILRKDCTFDLFIGCSSDNGQLGFALTHLQMKRLSVVPIDVIFDIYAGSAD